MNDTAKPRFEPCPICDNTGWVCEGHGNHPWRGVSNRPDSCDFGPGMPCPSSTCEHSLARREDDVGRLRDALIAAVSVFYEMANLLNDEDFAGEVPGLSGKVIGHRERYHKYMVEELSKAGDAARAALGGGCTCIRANGEACSNCKT